VEFRRLGRSGLTVSEIAYGNWITHGAQIDDEQAVACVRAALDTGITTFDTADVYAGTRAEEVLGRALKDERRDGLEILTKVYWRTGTGANDSGLSRKHIMTSIDGSLRRLGTDYVDVYYIHRFDDEVPVEETMEALHDVVKAGKVRYLGASSMYAWQFAKLQRAADQHGWTRFVAMQDQYNLLKREEEREMLPLCADLGVGCTPYSPLGKGRLTRPWGTQTGRSSTDVVAKSFDLDVDQPVVEAVQRVAEQRGVAMAHVALAWVLSKPVVSSPLVGATKPHHLADAAAALDLRLTDDEIAAMERPYSPQAPYWW